MHSFAQLTMEVRDARASAQAAQTWTAGFGLAHRGDDGVFSGLFLWGVFDFLWEGVQFSTCLLASFKMRFSVQEYIFRPGPKWDKNWAKIVF